VTSAAPATPSTAWARGAAWTRAFARDSSAIAEAELRKVARDPTEIFSRAVQPALWLIVFGQVFARMRAIPTGDLSYVEFLAPGILAQSVLFSAIFFGIAVIWERDLGIIHKLLVSPASRTALVLGKALAAGVRGLTQAVMIYVLAVVLGVRLQLAPAALLSVAAITMLSSALFATFSLIVACVVRTRERFMGIGQVLTMPLFFASNAIYPLSVMPGWLQTIARGNPLTYVVDALRGLMIRGGHSVLGPGVDVAFQAAVFLALLAIAARLYPGLVR
jgi:ABC-2 type transport system permease protein